MPIFMSVYNPPCTWLKALYGLIYWSLIITYEADPIITLILQRRKWDIKGFVRLPKATHLASEARILSLEVLVL